jgi:hypothetical protein
MVLLFVCLRPHLRSFSRKIALFLNTTGWRDGKIINPMMAPTEGGRLKGNSTSGSGSIAFGEFITNFGLIAIVSEPSTLLTSDGRGNIKLGPLVHMWNPLMCLIATALPELEMAFYTSKGDLVMYRQGMIVAPRILHHHLSL